LGVLAPGIGTLPVDVVIDHMGLAKAALGARQPGIDTLLRLLAGGRCWVKLSGAYRVSAQRDGFDDAAVIARCLIAANPDRVIWGSDWPHTAPHPGKVTDSSPLIEFRDVDDAQLFDRLIQWTGDARILSKVLVANPARLYGY
jgi:predicted TIM-barrel fold metal-dependent hydrolase